MLELETQYLASAMLAVSTEAARFYLQGVCVTWRPDESAVYYDATNGHFLFAARREIEDCSAPYFQIIIPTEALKTALKLAKKEPTITLSKTPNGSWALGALAFDPIDGTFPDVSHVMPRNDSKDWDKVAHFNPAYISALAAALSPGARRGHAMVNMRHNGDGPALVTGTLDDAIGILMPKRGGETRAVPQWAYTYRCEVKPDAA